MPKGLTIPKNFKKNGGPLRSRVRSYSIEELCSALGKLGLSSDHVADAQGRATAYGGLLLDYFEYRASVLNGHVESQLMDAKDAQRLYRASKRTFRPQRLPVMNKQKGTKRAEAFLTCLVNMILERATAGHPCNFDPLELTTFTRDDRPYRTLARRLDGAFPGPINPIAVWEVKEYYYTTTFGSRIADGVYETLLDGMEIEDFRQGTGIDVRHYLFVDSHFTWWGCGKSYLCRIIDMLHMGYVDEVLFGREVVHELPRIAREWLTE